MQDITSRSRLCAYSSHYVTARGGFLSSYQLWALLNRSCVPSLGVDRFERWFMPLVCSLDTSFASLTVGLLEYYTKYVVISVKNSAAATCRPFITDNSNSRLFLGLSQMK
ncbi:hypothetical protein NDU88_006500 [Pleurodeles waltl]|uniref:Uncharacterized protein n=1 Tax=Pleurodeles waltl TaxID=8319 RepID=A0AAV7MG25_PLEWA|nr:hypothetical protein NDU88_006500 [Pleurodeles waltl]